MLLERSPEYYNTLKTFRSSRIVFIKPVGFNEITRVLNKFDIGLYYLTPSNFNEKSSLPNKFFEFIQARLCIAISPVFEMKNIVEDNNLGIISDEFNLNDLANKIKSLSRKDILKFKMNVDSCSYKLSLDYYKDSALKEIKKL